MEKVKRCKQCGDLKPESQFRQYYKRSAIVMGEKTTGRYKQCLQCEKINTRYKYITKKGKTRTVGEDQDRRTIERLYEVLRQRGLEPPGSRDESEQLDLSAELQRQEAELKRTQEAGIPTDIPVELQEWLNKDLTGMSPDFLESVGDKLLETYRPQTGLDPKGLMPIYDDKYRDVINMILKRFDDYEDEY